MDKPRLRPDRVSAPLRELIPLAERWDIGDDYDRTMAAAPPAGPLSWADRDAKGWEDGRGPAGDGYGSGGRVGRLRHHLCSGRRSRTVANGLARLNSRPSDYADS